MNKPFLAQKLNRTMVLTLNRTSKGNSYDGDTAEALAQFLRKLREAPETELLVLRANGKNFCTGADLDWMARGKTESQSEAELEMRKIYHMYEAFLRLPVPVVGLVQGKVRGGGLGLVSVCDQVLALPDSDFALPEKSLGLIPGIIAPLLSEKIGHDRLALLENQTPLGAAEAQRIGLVSGIVNEFPQIPRLLCPAKRGRDLSALLLEMETMLVLSAEKRRGFRTRERP